MANVLYDETAIQDIANAIREKNGLTDTYNVSQMGDAIRAIKTGSGLPITSFTNVLGLDTTIIKEGYRMTSSGYSAKDNVRSIAILMPDYDTHTIRIRGIVPYNANIYGVSNVTLDGHDTAYAKAYYYDGYVDEYGDYAIDVATSNLQYVAFNMFAVDGAIITIDEPIGVVYSGS